MGAIIPVISMFYGIIVMMYFFDDKQHHLPHIHVEYAEESAALAIPSVDVLKGSIGASRLRLAQAWIEIQQEELMSNWKLAANGEKVFWARIALCGIAGGGEKLKRDCASLASVESVKLTGHTLVNVQRFFL